MALQDTDNFIVGRDEESYKITYQDLKDDLNYVPPPTGTIDQPKVLSPEDGAGSGDLRYLNSDTITKVEGGGENVYSTDTILSVDDASYSIGITANTSNNLTRFLDATLGTGYLDGSSNGTAYASFTGDPIRVKAGDIVTIQGVRQNTSHGLVLRLTDSNAQTSSVAVDNSTWAIGTWSDLAAYRSTAPYTINGDYILSGFAVTNTGSDSGVGGLYINGVKLIANFEADTVLTFPTDNNFDKFEVGDVVQGVAKQSGTTIGNPYTDARSWDTFWNDATRTQAVYSGQAINSVYVYNFNPKLTGELKIQKSSGQNVSTAEWIVVDSNGTTTFTGSDFTNHEVTLNVNNLESISIDNRDDQGRNNATVQELYLNGTALSASSGANNPVFITNIDADAVPPTITVDGGSWLGADGTGDAGDGRFEPAQEWTPYLTSSNGWADPTTTAENAFNGQSEPPAATNNGGTLTFSPNLTIPENSTIEGWFGSQDSANTDMDVTVNDVPNLNVQGNGWRTISYDNSDKLVSITIKRSDSSNSADLRGLRINGEELVNISIPGAAGDTNISKTVAYNTKLTVASEKDLADMSGAVYMTDGQTNPDGTYIPASYTPVTSTIESVVSTSVLLSFVVQSNTTAGGIAADPNCGTLDGTGLLWIADRAAEYQYGTNFDSHPNITDGDFVFPIFEINGVAKFTVSTSNPGGYGGKRVARFSDDGVTWGSIVEDDGDGTASEQFTFRNPTGAKYMAFAYSNDTTPATQVWGLTGLSSTTLTFESPNPDLQYFRPGDVVQSDPGDVTLDANQTNGFTNPENAFDGDVDTYAEMNNFSDAFLYFDIASGVTRISCTVENTNASAQNLRIQSGVNTYTNDGTWVVANGYVTNVNSIAIPANSGKVTVVFEPPAGANQARYYQQNGLADLRIYSTGDGSASEIKVISTDVDANTMVVDGGSWAGIGGDPAGETVVTGPTNTAEGTILEIDGTEVDLSASSGRWIANNAGGINFSIAGPSKVDEPLLTADITLVSSEFATTPVDADTLTNAKWTIAKQGGATEVIDAGAVTTFKPALGTFEPNSTYTISVQYEGFNLQPSPQSTSITFTTGATRTVYDRVSLLQARIDALEANEVSDDAVASSLITLLGSINARVSALENPESY